MIKPEDHHSAHGKKFRILRSTRVVNEGEIGTCIHASDIGVRLVLMPDMSKVQDHPAFSSDRREFLGWSIIEPVEEEPTKSVILVHSYGNED